VDRQADAAELLDGPLDDPAALAANLRDLATINRLTGGARLSVRAVRALADADRGGGDRSGDVATLLDVGTGAADIPMALLVDARAHGRSLHVTATDSRPEVLAAALVSRPSLERSHGLTVAIADGAALAYPDGAFDVAHSSLLLHHLEPPDAVAFLREMRRVATRGIVVNDLARSWPNWLGAWLLTRTLARSAYTRHDGPLSVRRAYTRREMVALLAEAALAPVATFVGFAGHRYAIAAS
jgi:SAM-dependent methyltransferase